MRCEKCNKTVAVLRIKDDSGGGTTQVIAKGKPKEHNKSLLQRRRIEHYCGR